MPNQSKLKAIIVDDEILAREELKRMLAKLTEIEVVGEAGNVEEAETLVLKFEPDIIFLDIEMPVYSGFELLDRLPNIPTVVFITAYEQFALKAFNYDALDYLLKPIDELRLEKTIGKIKASKINDDPEDNIGKQLQKMFIKDGDRCFFVSHSDIFYILAEGNYSRIYFQDKRAIINKSLNKILDRLDEPKFFRANRQEVFNIDFIDTIDAMDRSCLIITLKNGKNVELSSRQTQLFKKTIGF